MTVNACRVRVQSDALSELVPRTTFTTTTAAIGFAHQLPDHGPKYWAEAEGEVRFLIGDVDLAFHVFEVIGDCALTVVVSSNANSTDGVTVVTYPIAPGFVGELRRSLGAELFEAARPDPSRTFVAIGCTVGGGGSIEFSAALAPSARSKGSR